MGAGRLGTPRPRDERKLHRIADRFGPQGERWYVVQTSARLLKLPSLLQSRRLWTGAELARELEITERSVRRDVDRLRSLGYPVHAATGIRDGYQLGAGNAGETPPEEMASAGGEARAVSKPPRQVQLQPSSESASVVVWTST
ncbi:helix-turn-helix domain-containing protein [Sorangium sp. So ce1335]